LSGLTCATQPDCKEDPPSHIRIATDVAAQIRWLGRSAGPYQNPADVAAQTRLQGRSAGPYQNPRLILLPRNVEFTNQFGTVNLVVWADLCQNVPQPVRWLGVRLQGRSAGPYQNSRLMLLLRNVEITNQFGTVNLVVWADLCQNVPQPVRWLGGSAGPYQNPRLILLPRNVQITNQFGTVNLVVWADLCHAKRAPTSQMARRIRQPISESAADVAAQIRWLGRSAGPYQNPRLMLLLRLSGLTCATPARLQGRSAVPYQNPRLMLLLRNVEITNQFGTVNLVVWADLCHSSQIARKIRRPISESAADLAAQKCEITNQFGTVNLVVCADCATPARLQGRSASPYQNPRLILLPRNVEITNQFGTVNLVVWADLCHSSQIARKIRRPISESAADRCCPDQIARKIRQPISESAADLAAQKCRNYEPFGTVNLVVWADLCHSSQIARKIRRPISESAADVAAQTRLARKIRQPISESAADLAAQTRLQGRSAGPYQNPRLMLLLRNVEITNQFGTVNLVVWADLCHSSQIARKIRRPISESAADLAAQSECNRPGTHILEQNVEITNQFGTGEFSCLGWTCATSSQIARKIRRPISESAADLAAPEMSNYEPIWARQIARKIRRPISESAADLAARNVEFTNQFGTVNLVVWAEPCHSSQIARKIRRPISESRLMLLLRNVEITNQFGTVNLVVWGPAKRAPT
ncbi:hypothetical protein GGX14DRAFT_409354, partial [Mycena pura]